MTRPRPPEASSCSARRSDPAFVRSIDADCTVARIENGADAKQSTMDALQRAMTGEMFLAYVEQCLVPTLRRNDIVAMDRPVLCCALRRLASN
jgi:hypothetical protein